MDKYRRASEVSNPDKEATPSQHLLAEIVTGQTVKFCSNMLAEVHVNYWRFLPEGAQKELRTAIVALTKFDQELAIAVRKVGKNG